ncbi:hypothetical protein AVEN_242640-1 [Araneus ventricosus]|uniref:Integrase catalytic domain-containing protein n=1 Tax=Araneus ventricosus TaxID=182803 RepID=A0A4Y2N9Q8_ARAVE|nr:hypothetical protein AVEN_242640-1 [Araneus ventricosus]
MRTGRPECLVESHLCATADTSDNPLTLKEESKSLRDYSLMVSPDFIKERKGKLAELLRTFSGVVYNGEDPFPYSRMKTASLPQTSGRTERFNKTLADILSMPVGVEQKDWDEILPFLTFAYNTVKWDFWLSP